MIKNVLITGSRGFVGSRVCNYLYKKYNLLTPSRNELNLLDKHSVDRYFNENKIDAVIHCALTGREVLFSLDPVYLSDGLLMFRNLWTNKEKYKLFVNLGTAYELDLTKNNDNVLETEFIKHLPTPSYGLAKNLIARTILTTENFYNLRLFGVFHEDEKSIRFFQRVKNDNEVVIKNDQYLDYIYLSDIAPVIDHILQGKSSFRDINMVYEKKYRLSEMAHKLCEILNLDRSKIIVENKEGKNLTGDSKRLSSFNLELIGLENGFRNYL